MIAIPNMLWLQFNCFLYVELKLYSNRLVEIVVKMVQKNPLEAKGGGF